ncbi:hypothetical protein M2368_003547 [Arthrobacter sp. JUb119]|nr:hypothetical protein [Arthrobacter sp. JUb119]TDU22605.1 hypothetical protein EDF61_109135 [Arthrobacter sp. JUb115]
MGEREHIRYLEVQVNAKLAEIVALRKELHWAIRDALQGGAGISELAISTGMSRSEICKIRDSDQ